MPAVDTCVRAAFFELFHGFEFFRFDGESTLPPQLTYTVRRPHLDYNEEIGTIKDESQSSTSSL